jgi:methylenetetrahydrofolate dehydrogenase (NADP+)/methenyltetrahydrofolate cyclohydrolase
MMPRLAIVLVDPAKDSEAYVRKKREACEAVGIECMVKQYGGEVSQSTLEKEIRELCADPKLHGMIIQLPVPPHLNSNRLVDCLPPNKDVDCLHPYNVGCLSSPSLDINFLPPAPYGMLQLLQYGNVSIVGKRCVVVGRGHLVARPTAHTFLSHTRGNICLTMLDVNTLAAEDLREETLRADILVAATNQPLAIRADMVRRGAVLLDAGSHYIEGELPVGNADAAAYARCSHYTPVPGGVGPMTVTSLLLNCYRAAARQLQPGVHLPPYLNLLSEEAHTTDANQKAETHAAY